MNKIITFAVPALLAVSAFAPLAQADTMMASSSMMHDTMTTSSGMMMSEDLSYGSKGDRVVTLQTWLVKKGLLTLPEGVSMGYFGPLTQAALIAYQTSVGLPAHGYYGALTRAKHSSDDAMMMKTSDNASMKHDTDTMMSSSSMTH